MQKKPTRTSSFPLEIYEDKRELFFSLLGEIYSLTKKKKNIPHKTMEEFFSVVTTKFMTDWDNANAKIDDLVATAMTTFRGTECDFSVTRLELPVAWFTEIGKEEQKPEKEEKTYSLENLMQKIGEELFLDKENESLKKNKKAAIKFLSDYIKKYWNHCYKGRKKISNYKIGAITAFTLTFLGFFKYSANTTPREYYRKVYHIISPGKSKRK